MNARMLVTAKNIEPANSGLKIRVSVTDDADVELAPGDEHSVYLRDGKILTAETVRATPAEEEEESEGEEE